MTEPILSLVTGTLNRFESFLRLAGSVLERTDVPFEFIVADASDEPITFEHPNVRILPEPKRLGYVKGYNRAFKACRGRWVIYLNDDAEVCEGYAKAALDFMVNHPRIGLGCLHYSECGGPFHVNSAWGAPYANFGIISRELGDKIGWFDERLQMYGSDNSLALRVLKADYGIAGIPNARILHHSVKDQLRHENQRSRQRDNFILQTEYRITDGTGWIKRAYERHRVPNDSLAWPHGVSPEYSKVKA